MQISGKWHHRWRESSWAWKAFQTSYSCKQNFWWWLTNNNNAKERPINILQGEKGSIQLSLQHLLQQLRRATRQELLFTASKHSADTASKKVVHSSISKLTKIWNLNLSKYSHIRFRYQLKLENNFGSVILILIAIVRVCRAFQNGLQK